MPLTADPVRQQYEDYPFPKVDPADESRRLQIMPQDALLTISHRCFAGRRDLRQGCRVLVAGGGTGHASVFLAEQLRGTGSEIVQLDLSRASLDIAKARVARRGLDVTFLHGSLLDLPKMDLGAFDYINCTGVLHHLPDPDAGLAALTSVLDESGAMGLMVYGRYGRRHVYVLQDLLRRLRAADDSSSDRIRHAYAMMETLPPWFYASTGIHQARHIEAFRRDETNVVDTFLHAQDRAYTVDEVYELVEGAGLCFNGFASFQATLEGRMWMNPLRFVRDPELRERIAAASPREQAAIAELVHPRVELHSFYVSFRNPTAASPDDDDLVPEVNGLRLAGQPLFEPFDGPTIAAFLRAQAGGISTISHPTGRRTFLSNEAITAALVEGIDGKRTSGDICRRAQSLTGATRGMVRETWASVLASLGEIDWVLLRHRDIAPYASYDDLQAHMSENPA
ncbi:MAG: class I SAM-dependent methyltransferase [Myxococcota bacterium]